MGELSVVVLQFLVAALVGGFVVRFAMRRWQMCPHCRRVVPRASRGWLRCTPCGRQYHRRVRLKY